MRDALAAAAAVIWFALNIVLWILRLPDLVQFVCSIALASCFSPGSSVIWHIESVIDRIGQRIEHAMYLLVSR